MAREYIVKRKLHAQGGSFLVALPRIWVQAEGLKNGDEVFLVFNGLVKVLPDRLVSGDNRRGRGIGSLSGRSRGLAPAEDHDHVSGSVGDPQYEKC
jgi:hypothetical protein